jgi:hypothetical protein
LSPTAKKRIAYKQRAAAIIFGWEVTGSVGGFWFTSWLVGWLVSKGSNAEIYFAGYQKQKRCLPLLMF